MSAHTTPPRDVASAPPPATSHAGGTPPLPLGLPDRIRAVIDLYKTQIEAAAFVGVTPETLQNWSKGRQRPSFVELTTLAATKGVNLNWLATGQGEMLDSVDSLAGAVKSLPREIREPLAAAIVLLANAHRQHLAKVDALIGAIEATR